MYRGICPYCGAVFESKYRDVVKTELKYHMIKEHREELLSEALNTKYGKIFGPETALKWRAGQKAAYNIEEI